MRQIRENSMGLSAPANSLGYATESKRSATDPRSVHRLARQRLLSLQSLDGSWEGEMAWSVMILSQYVITRHLLGRPLPPGEIGPIVQHYRVKRLRQTGWGLHAASAGPSLYCTSLAYIALRLLGLAPDHPLCRPARQWLRTQPGGVAAIPSWGKFWLALLGLYDYRAMHPLLPELFLLPKWLPLHPDRLYCHTRTISQAMTYLYGTRFQGPQGEVVEDLRRELFDRPLRRSDRHRTGIDAAVSPTVPLRLLQRALALYERRPPLALRRRALDRCRARVEHEHAVTGRLGLSPVNSLLDILVLHASGEKADKVDRSLTAFDYWRWTDPHEGSRYAGARSQTWDTAFAVEALLADHAPCPDTVRAVARANRFLTGAQITTEIPTPHLTARSPARGGWCFSEGGHSWPVSDCTAEAVSALLAGPGASRAAPTFDTSAATEFLLARQNRDGGFGTYEARRASRLLEHLNPAEMFTHCMVEGSYTECTGSAAVALVHLQGRVNGTQRHACKRALSRARTFLLSTQDADGSWPAAWGINRIYGTLFAIRGLLATGVPRTHPCFVRAGWWLESIQLADGGWGEDHTGCIDNRYVPGATSQPVSTAWALLALLELTGGRSRAVLSGIAWLCDRQLPDGSWPQTAATGVFFGTAMLDYRLYREYFPLWALGRWLATHPAPEIAGNPAAHTPHLSSDPGARHDG
ncbi:MULTISPECIES: prenyltransferase/squalene oxidase repeat-containing protein [Streptomyces]|uniref:prenyltransferase/squalene oxidase repeat-containing protein n=1 Tax=Streptomyces TaxID=1883 RepID=UPI000F5587BB|nr:prenyltransferase/squalene oxidase repeat-containing protein [Streptomyces sp. ADI97-07]